MLNLILTPLAILLIVAGMVLWISPIPVGLPMIVLGLFMLLAVNRRAVRLARRLRRRLGWLDRAFRFAEDRAGERIGRTLRRTRPNGRSARPEPPPG